MIESNAIEPNGYSKKVALHDIWLISDKVAPDIKSEIADDRSAAGQVMEYMISDLAKYLINPNPIEVMNTLVGCKISYQKSAALKMKYLMKNKFMKSFFRHTDESDVHEETYISDFKTNIQDMEDSALQLHIDKMKELLIPYDTLVEKMSNLDTENIIDIVAIVEDQEGNRSHVILKGTVADKIECISNNIQKKLGVVIERAYLNSGLFEMRGFDFESYDPEKYSRLLVVFNNDKPEAFVLTPAGNVEFNVKDIELVKCLLFLQMSLKTNGKIKQLFAECIKGAVKPLKLMFNKELEIDYFKTDLPNIYQEVFKACDISSNVKDIIVKALNQKQVGILINYLPKSPHGKNRPVTNVYVMHDIKALEPVKKILPQLYSEIDKKIGVLEENKYYLMDSMKGYSDAK